MRPNGKGPWRKYQPAREFPYQPTFPRVNVWPDEPARDNGSQESAS